MNERHAPILEQTIAVYPLGRLEVLMINANVIKGVHEFLGEHGLEQKPDERFSDFVARALNISSGQAEVLLEALNSGATPEQALAQAEIDPNVADSGLL
ncbi:MAG: hypothetical protein QOJ42_7970, partial [Acidobacteriaceae bacterium]|nr:hypothetical protein [Acidobacteriaceae bacterium]